MTLLWLLVWLCMSQPTVAGWWLAWLIVAALWDLLPGAPRS